MGLSAHPLNLKVSCLPVLLTLNLELLILRNSGDRPGCPGEAATPPCLTGYCLSLVLRSPWRPLLLARGVGAGVDDGLGLSAGPSRTRLCLGAFGRDPAAAPGPQLLDVVCGSGVLLLAGVAAGAQAAWGWTSPGGPWPPPGITPGPMAWPLLRAGGPDPPMSPARLRGDAREFALGGPDGDKWRNYGWRPPAPA